MPSDGEGVKITIDDSGKMGICGANTAPNQYSTYLSLLSLLSLPVPTSAPTSAYTSVPSHTSPKVAAVAMLYRALKDTQEWDPILLHLWLSDSMGGRTWVENQDADCREVRPRLRVQHASL